MATATMKLLIIVFISAALAIETPTYTLENAQDCESFCEKSPNVSSKICSRGCRFYTISKFLKPNGNILDLCENSCDEAYGHDYGNLYSCQQGCRRKTWTQKHFSLNNGFDIPEVSSTSEGDAPAAEGSGDEEDGMLLHMMTPILQVRRVVSQVVGSIHILKRSVLTLFMKDNNSVLAVESQPEMIIEMLPNEDGQVPKAFEDSGLQPADESNNNVKSWSLDDLNPFRLRQEEENNLVEEASGDSMGVHYVSVVRTFSYAPLLCLILLLAAIALSLLAIRYCFAVARRQQRRKAKAANLAAVLQTEPLKLVRPEDLTKLSLLEEDQAPPLPSKQDLALTHAHV